LPEKAGRIYKTKTSMTRKSAPPLLLALLLLASCDKISRIAEENTQDQNSNVEFSNDKVVENITSQERQEALELTEAKDPVEEEQKRFQSEIRSMFEEEKFKELEFLARKLSETRERFPDGSWKISSFYDGINNRFNTTDAGYSADAALHQKWSQEVPDSPVQLTAYADLLVDYAWKARGSGYANTVTKEMWKKMYERLEGAMQALKAAKKTGAEDIHWYRVALRVGVGQGWSTEDFNKIVANSLEKEPEYYLVPQNRAYSLLPRWYGKEEEMEAFAARTAKKLGARGNETYARITISLYGFYNDIFRETNLEWAKVKPGLEELIEKHPQSLTLKNHAAYLATLARDRDFAAKCFEELGNSYTPSVWGKPERFVHFRGWARTGEW
jgi:hypothetical protein